MKKALVVSSIPYSNSNRGIDILCSALIEKDYSVDHYVFPVQKLHNHQNKVNEENSGIIQKYAQNSFLGYYEKLMWFMPKIIVKKAIEYNLKSNNIDFSDYDVIVLESGKPIMLIDLIPSDKKIIYRQSDSVKFILSRNSYLWELEEKVIERAHLIFIVRDLFKQSIDKKYWNKTKTIVNGFNLTNDVSTSSKKDVYKNNSINAVYLGYTPLDYDTLVFLCEKNREINYHIIGKCLSSKEIKRLEKYSNFFYYGNLPSSKYLPYVKNADIAIVPYKKWRGLNYIGLNSKYLLFMRYNLPIVSYKVGALDEFKNIPVFFCKDKNEFYENIIRLKNKNFIVNYDIDFNFYSKQGRIAEYLKFIQ